MTLEEILERLVYPERPFPSDVIAAAREQREAIVPILLERFEMSIVEVAEESQDPDDIGYLYALYLLSEFREPRLYPLLVRFCSLPSHLVEDALDDLLTEDLHRLLASVWNGDDRPLKSLIENPQVNEWARGAGIRAMATLVARGLRPREEVVAYFRTLLTGPPTAPCTNFWDELVCCATDLHPEELMTEVRHVYEAGLVDASMIAMEDVERDLARGQKAVLEELARDETYSLVDDAGVAMSGWFCFSEQARLDEMAEFADFKEGGHSGRFDEFDELDGPDGPDWEHDEFFESGGGHVPTTYQREEPKVGRNDPCPCGSGKKFKKCCGV